ncbi:neuropeptide-like protein C4orf48-like [Silurus meridionalis]|nr:neuropeptide-like protein C4orf48-like [Silurus meridionalis]
MGVAFSHVTTPDESESRPQVRVMMRSSCVWAPLLLMLLVLAVPMIRTEPDSGTVIPAESRPCVDCHAFEFMQRALQDLKKTAFNLDSRTENLVLRAERRALCDCTPINTLN